MTPSWDEYELLRSTVRYQNYISMQEYFTNYTTHDYSQNGDDRQNYLEAAYTAPEELLWEMKIPVGILGVPRKYLDAMLKIKEISTKKKLSTMKPIPEFVLPPKIPYKTMGISKTLEKKPCKYTESESTKLTRLRQCKMWRKYIEDDGMPPIFAIDIASPFNPPSLTTLRTSIAPAYSKYN